MHHQTARSQIKVAYPWLWVWVVQNVGTAVAVYEAIRYKKAPD